MSKDSSISVRTTEVYPDDASDHPITRQYATHTTQPELPPTWPAEPHALTTEPTTERWLLLFDIAMILIPLALIAKIILCIVAYHLDKGNAGYLVDEVHALTIYLIRFNHQLTTIFTVVFILIITIVVRRLALYMAQEGATIAKLEQLQASISLPGTLKAMWSLRSYGRTSAALIFVWGWFYLGSQATISEYEHRTSGSAHKYPMAYFSSQKQSLFFPNHSVAKVSDVTVSKINSIYNVFSLVSAGKANSPTGWDLNGAARVPYLSADGTPFVGSPALRRKRHGWYDVSEASKLNYVSYIGTSIYTYSSEEDEAWVNGMEGDYKANATYWNTTCTERGIYDASAFPSGTLKQSNFAINSTGDIDTANLDPQDPPRPFDVWARVNSTSPVGRVSCHVHGIPVEMHVHCSAGQCGAKRMRFSPDAPPINRTAFDSKNFTSVFFNNLLLANGVPTFDTESLAAAMENDGTDMSSVGFFLCNGFDDMLSTITNPGAYPSSSWKDVQDSDNSYLSFEMTSVINTYYQAALDPTQGSPEDDNVQTDLLSNIINKPTHSKDWTTGTIKGSPYNPHYALSIPWIVVDFVSCKILLLASLLSFWLRKRTLAPDIFGYVSSLTRDNPHLNLPEGGSTMSGLERARMLKDLKVKIADVADENGVGKVGLRYAGPAAEFNMQTAHLKRDRHYV